MKQYLDRNQHKIWYMICFMTFGLIDQRRGSAVGEVQMIFSNITGIVLALMLFPSLDWTKLYSKIYLYWTFLCIPLSIGACFIGKMYWPYIGQWIVGVLNVSLWSYLIIYIVREWQSVEGSVGVRKPFYVCVFVMFVLMVLSAHEKKQTLWYMLIYGGFYLVGIPEERKKDFFEGMINGIIIWFFVQQIIAFGFRPYDYIRYKGLYSGETQNGLFYMTAYCAFISKWLWTKCEKGRKIYAWFNFLMAASCVSFLLFTSSRSGLLGVVLVTLVLVTGYDIVEKKSIYKWILHGFALGMCIVILTPAVYGCIRYLPTVLHHPIWYEGEYVEGKSVCSFDPWDSPKYISFETAMEDSLGRIFHAFGIEFQELFDGKYSFWGGLKVHAKTVTRAEGEELDEPGSSPTNLFVIDEIDTNDAMWARKVIYVYYWKHLNLLGHSGANQGFYTIWDRYFTHAHNMFLQTAYDYGIPAGLLFIAIYLYSIFRALRMRKPEGWVCTAFLLAIACFGMLEMTVTPGQITVPLMWIMFYFSGKESSALPQKERT